jgi:Glycosyltransferase
MYFQPIFEGFIKAFPDTNILVDKNWKIKENEILPLDPRLNIKKISLRGPSDSGDYGRELELPSPSLVYHLMRRNPDLLILFDYSRVTWLGAFTARLLPKCRVLLLVESDPKFRGVEHQGIQLGIRKLIAKQADAILTNNRHGEAYLTGVLGADPKRVIAAPYLTSQPGTQAEIEGTESPPQSQSTPVRFLFLNSITHRKGVDCLIRAVAALDPERRQAMHVRIVGDGPQRSEVELLTDELGVRDRVDFVGRVPYSEVGTYFRSADVFVGLTLRDYRSLTGFEALSFGLPILMSCHDGAVSEVVEEGQNGVVVDPRDTAAFASGLAWFIDNRERLGEMREASKRLNQRFTVASVVGNLVDACERALTRR